MAEAVVGGAFLRIGENAVSFGGLTEFYFGNVFLFGIAVRMPFERGFTVGRLDFVGSGGAYDAKDFVIIALHLRSHDELPVSLNKFGASPVVLTSSHLNAARWVRPKVIATILSGRAMRPVSPGCLMFPLPHVP